MEVEESDFEDMDCREDLCNPPELFEYEGKSPLSLLHATMAYLDISITDDSMEVDSLL